LNKMVKEKIYDFIRSIFDAAGLLSETIDKSPCGVFFRTGKYENNGAKLDLHNSDVREWIQRCQDYFLSKGETRPPWDLPPLPPLGPDGLPRPPTGAAGSSTSDTIQSSDPNELIGPAGYGAANYRRGDGLFAYRINFQNATNATAPAQVVV